MLGGKPHVVRETCEDAFLVKVRLKSYDKNWRWTNNGISFPDKEWWRRGLWPDLNQAEGNAKWWRAGGWEAKVVRVTRRSICA